MNRVVKDPKSVLISTAKKIKPVATRKSADMMKKGRPLK